MTNGIFNNEILAKSTLSKTASIINYMRDGHKQSMFKNVAEILMKVPSSSGHRYISHLKTK